MTTTTLTPQTFQAGAVTQLPAFSMYDYAISQLPGIYDTAPNFLSVIASIAAQKQNLYDILRSLVNVFNLNDTGAGTASATPSGVFAEMIASVFNAPITISDSSATIINTTQQSVVFVNSRGYPSDFYKYFALTGIASSFTNLNVMEAGNASLFFSVPVFDTPLLPPNPYDVFLTAMQKLKGAGIEVNAVGENIPFFQYGSLPTDDPPLAVAPGNAGFGILQLSGITIGGGFLGST